MAGKLIIFSGPSGAGKSTIVKFLQAQESLALVFSISATSRPIRGGEENGKDYHFLSIDEFKARIDENRFLEWEEVYPGQYYGTLKTDVERMLAEGKNIIFDIDVAGGTNIKRKYKGQALSIFVKPPSIDDLQKRLESRNTDTPESIQKRVRKAKLELTYARRFDNVIENKDLDTAQNEALKLISDFLN